MELKSYGKSEVVKGLEYLVKNARNKSNAKQAGEVSKPTMEEDGFIMEDISGFSVQYSIEYQNYLVTIFNKNSKSYSLKIKDSKLQQWLSILTSIDNNVDDDFNI